MEGKELRLVTYMCPTHPVQLYELIMDLLESKLGCVTTLQYESRTPGPFKNRPDPFTNDKIDIAFMTVQAYMDLRESNNKAIELLPVTPVFAHQMNVENKPGYFSDIIVHKDKMNHNVNTLLDLRGCNFAYSYENSLSSCKLVLKTLYEKGENASFFGSTMKSGSHLESAQMVLSKQAEWAAVDATTLLYSKKFMQDRGADIATLETLGRLPPYPIVVNTNLPGGVKKKLTDVFLTATDSPSWKKSFSKFGVIKFSGNSDGMYNGEVTQVRAIKSEAISIRYY